MREQCVDLIKMMLSLVLVGMVASALFISCISFTSISPYEHGYAVGTAVYAGYSKIAEGKDDAFHAKMSMIWRKINEINNKETLATDVAELTGLFDALTGSGKYTKEELEAMRTFRDLVLSRIDSGISKSYSNERSIQFLEGTRAGINAMVALHNASQKEAADDKDN